MSMTPKDEVWSLGKARLWRYRSAEVAARAAGHAVPRARRRLGHLRPPPRQLLGRAAGRRGLRRLPLRLGHARRPRRATTRSRRTSTATSSTPSTPCAASRRPTRCPWAPTAWARSWRCCCSAAATTSRAATSSCSRRRATSSTPRRSWTATATGRMEPADAIDETTGLVPEGAVRAMFRLLAADVRRRPVRRRCGRTCGVTTTCEAHRAVNHWAWNHRAMAGPAFTELITEYVQGNRLDDGRRRELGGRAVRLATITVPTLVVVAERDEFVPPANSEPLPRPAGLRRHRGPPGAGRPRRRADGVGGPTGDDAGGRGLAQAPFGPS